MKRTIEAFKNVRTPLYIVVIMIISAFMIASYGTIKRDGMTTLERRISDTLSEIEGVGKIRVVIRTKEKHIQGKILGFQNQVLETPCGAVAAAEGAENPVTRMRLIHALCALLGLQASEVEVIDMD